MSGTFTARVDELITRTRGRVKGSVEVDQVYAHYQHEHPEFHHPDGGEAFYLKTPLYLKVRDYMKNLAEGALSEKGVVGAMSESMEDLSMEVYDRAPWEFADLRASGHPKVTKDGVTVYDREPHVHRLDSEELKEKAHLRYLFDPHRYRR